jgi:hypothetical protein
VVPSCLLEPIWVEFHATIGGDRPPFHPKHPLGCHRRRIPDRIVFEHVIDALVHGSGYERIATRACSDRTIRRRLAEWSAAGVAHAVHAAALRAYDLIIGVQPDDIVFSSAARSRRASSRSRSRCAPGRPGEVGMPDPHPPSSPAATRPPAPLNPTPKPL